ncbi:MAG TPA: HAMP domain-containing sensor histidine kinase [Gammaproteobacteria bacterium]|nr:HAMP domain-containing sensor histidine kinase [Gammaproteobacteria bacterium]
MGFKNFRLNVAARALLLFGFVLLAVFGVESTGWQVTPVAAAILAVLVLVELVRYVETVNRELAGFLSFVAHDDFTVTLPLAGKGKVFRELESAYRVLAGKYRNLNLQREANHRYLEALVEHVSIALVCLDESGEVTLMNRQAKALFKTPHLSSLKSFARVDAKLPAAIEELSDEGRALVAVRIEDEALQLALFATEFDLLGDRYKLISFQNIRDELEQREIDYSQKLIKVLTHEIMNSVTPIISLTKLIRDRLLDAGTGELSLAKLGGDEQQDLARGLASIQSRGSGLLKFVKAYGELTNLPRPHLAPVEVAALLDRVHALMSPALDAEGLVLEAPAVAPNLIVRADPQQIEQVLINLIKNAAEALAGRADGRVQLRGARDEHGKVSIHVADNGPGIDAAHVDDVFLPFYTTKRNGSGVGLSVSRQIMALHKGALTVKTSPGRGSEFTLRFR